MVKDVVTHERCSGRPDGFGRPQILYSFFA
jgi:hypothetical protein